MLSLLLLAAWIAMIASGGMFGNRRWGGAKGAFAGALLTMVFVLPWFWLALTHDWKQSV